MVLLVAEDDASVPYEEGGECERDGGVWRQKAEGRGGFAEEGERGGDQGGKQVGCAWRL